MCGAVQKPYRLWTADGHRVGQKQFLVRTPDSKALSYLFYSFFDSIRVRINGFDYHIVGCKVNYK